LFCGDAVGRSGREAVLDNLPRLKQELAPEFIVVNGENAAHGFGITEKICEEMFEAGVDVITGGNHIWDKADIIPYMEQEPRLLRPVNYSVGTPGRGFGEFTAPGGRKVKVINVQTRLFMELTDDPFAALDAALPPGPPKGNGFDAIIVDVHGEATSEKMALGHISDGRASLVAGTHTHVPTADAYILEKGTGYMTDIGMCGDYDSVIGMKKESALARFRRKATADRLSPADGEGTLCAAFVETDDESGLATRISPIRLGGRLQERMPE
jgi:metallophosphoesterase (TIGR00282 family)